MTNLEWVLNEGVMDEGDRLCALAYYAKYGVYCRDKDCSDCCFFENKEECLKELLKEHKEWPKLNGAEKVILSNIDKKFEWIAKDKSGDGWVCEGKPYKSAEYWESSLGDVEHFLNVFPDLFKFIKWEDEEPYNIKELLEANGVKENE